MPELSIPLSTPMSPEQIEQVQAFRERFHELWSNWQSLKKLGIKFGGGFQNRGNGTFSGPSCGIELHRLKGYYLDYRFFHAPKEPTCYFRVSNLISAHCTDATLRAGLKRDRTSWHDAGILRGWHDFDAEALINSMFNGALFHSAKDVKPTKLELHAAMSDDLVHHHLALCIYDRMLVIRNLNWLLQPLTLENQHIRIPDMSINQDA